MRAADREGIIAPPVLQHRAADTGNSARHARAAWALALLGAFGLRLLFGLCSEFWFEDETQIFLLGLRFHSTHAWPYFGPDVVWTRSQIPGALQALLVGLRLDLLPVP